MHIKGTSVGLIFQDVMNLEKPFQCVKVHAKISSKLVDMMRRCGYVVIQLKTKEYIVKKLIEIKNHIFQVNRLRRTNIKERIYQKRFAHLVYEVMPHK